jgi:hypothetical protein
MILGMSADLFTLVHVILSLVGIGLGLIVVFGLLTANRLPRLTALFFASTAATSLSGFLFPFKGFTPGIAVGILSIFVLLMSIFARYGRALAGPWQGTYVISTALALYFNVLVLITQLFEKVSPLKALAPTQTEAPFKLTQLVVMAFFILITTLAFKRFRS